MLSLYFIRMLMPMCTEMYQQAIGASHDQEVGIVSDEQSVLLAI